MLIEILKMLGLVILQNASFTLVSRARNSNSLLYHAIASVLSNGIWLLVIRQVVINFNNWQLMVAYVVGAVIGSVIMHHIAMKYFEKPKKSAKREISFLKEELRILKVLKEITVKGQDFEFAALVRNHERDLQDKLEEKTNTNSNSE